MVHTDTTHIKIDLVWPFAHAFEIIYLLCIEVTIRVAYPTEQLTAFPTKPSANIKQSYRHVVM